MMPTRKQASSVFALASIAALAAPPARADGCYVSPEEQDLLEPTQIGLVVHDGAREDLYLQVDFAERSGRTVSRMGWVLALPAVPVVAEADENLFVELMQMTRPYEDDDPLGFGCAGEKADSDSSFGGDRAVEIESRQVVGAFDVTTVASESTAPLAAWIEERGFILEDGSEEILQFYIDKAWHFVAVDVDLAEAAADGFLPPLEFSFDSAQPVFPLRISAINGLGDAADTDDEYYEDGYTEVLLYAVASSALTVPNMNVTPEFVHALDGADLADFPAVRAALPNSGVIVKIRLEDATEAMTDDLYLTPVANTAAMLSGRVGPIDLSWIAIGLLVACSAARGWRRKDRSRG